MMTDQSYVMAALAIWAVWGVSWFASAFWIGRSVGGAPGRSFALQLGIVALGYAGLFAEAPNRLRSLWHVGPVAGAALVALVGAGAALAWWARLQLGTLWSAGITRREGHRIVESGPYAIVRHPIYTAIIAGGIGLAALKATPIAICGAALLAIGFGWKARIEERFLGAELGEADYAAYRQRVPMLIPFAPPRGHSGSSRGH